MSRLRDLHNDFRVMLRKSFDGAKGPRHDELRVLATALWAEKVRVALGMPSPYAVERHINPKAFRFNSSGDPYHDNKWSRYAVGRHQPVNALVTQVDKIIPGTTKLLRHPLWDILRAPDMVVGHKEKWLHGLDGDIQRIVLDPGSRRIGKQDVGARSATKVQLDMLRRRAGIDALTALTALMLESRQDGRTELALRIGDYVFHVLLITCQFPPFRLLAREIFDCFQRRVFADIEHGGERIDLLAVIDCEDAIELLSLAVRQVRNARDFGYEQKDIVPVCVKLLHVRYPGTMFALASPRVLADQNGEATESCRKRIARINSLREWGIENTLGLRAEKFPPRDVRSTVEDCYGQTSGSD